MARVKTIDQQPIEPEVCGDCEPIVSAGLDPVRVRTFLALRIPTHTSVLDKGGGLPEMALFGDREYGQAPPRVVGDQNVVAGLVKGDIARVGAARCDLIQS